MATRKKKPAKRGKSDRKVRDGLRLATLALGYVPMSRKLKVTSTTLLATLVGGLARESSEQKVLARFVRLYGKRKAA